MIILAVDFGDARTGLACCDRSELLASPAGVISETDFEVCIQKTAEAAREHRAEQIVVGYPDVKGREEILRVHAKNKPLGPDVNLKTIARTTQGFTGADLENLLNEAALLAARANRKAIIESDIEEASFKVMAGPEKKSRLVTESDKKITAYHEAGHAIATYNLETTDKVHQVSVIQRGMAAGLTWTRPQSDDSHVSRRKMQEELIVFLGGRVAESLMLDDICTGASNDVLPKWHGIW